MKAVNLIPNEQRPAVKTSAGGPVAPAEAKPVGAYAILGALVFAVGAMALLVLTNNSIAKNKAELAQVKSDASTVERQASTLQSFADFKQLSSSRQDTVTGLAAARFPWPQTLDDVSRALPADVFVSSLDGSTATSSSGGSSLRGAIQAPSIELNGCTKNQQSVAQLMSRLRDVRGVTRVSLAKSESSDEPVTAAAPAPATPTDGDASAVTSDACPKGSPPTFDVIVFFERAAVSPNAAPNGSAAGITGPTGAVGSTAGPTGSTGATTPASSTTTP